MRRTLGWMRPGWLVAAAAIVVFALVGSGRTRQAAIFPGEAWETGAPSSAGLDPAAFEAIDARIRQREFGNIDRVLVVQGGRLVVDHRYEQDYAEISRGWVGPLGCGEGCADPAAMHDFNYYHPRFHPFQEGREVHSLQSVTKSIAATVIGVAIGRGTISGVDHPLLDFFDDRDLSRVDPRTRTATLADLLTMRSGIEWHEVDRPLDDTNTTLQLERSRDWIQFTLDQPADAAPGSKWAYNSGGSHLMSGIIRRATGRFIDAYAAEYLFGPLGITDWYWKKTPTGYPDTEGGLYLRAEDLARIGLLYLRDGLWNGSRILPEGWVEQATTRHVTDVAAGWDYGYQWWLTRRNGLDVWAGRGFGGQLLFVVPARDVVGVVNAWNIFDPPTGNLSGAFLDALTGG